MPLTDREIDESIKLLAGKPDTLTAAAILRKAAMRAMALARIEIEEDPEFDMGGSEYFT